MNWSMKDVRVENAKLYRVIDGDTYEIYLPVCCKEYIFKCRLEKINTFELQSSDENEKHLAQLAKSYVEEILKNKFNILCKSFDKYGRVLCKIDVWIDEKYISLSELLMIKNYAKLYQK